MPKEAGLRERKKQATRDALSWAALRLAVERGLSAVSLEDIAAEVGVSPRTFSNYFGSKAEAIAVRHFDRVRAAAVALRARAADEPLWPAVIAAALAPFGQRQSGPPDPDWVMGVRLLLAEPALHGEYLKARAVAEVEFAEAVAERTGADPRRDMHPRLVAAAVGGAVDVAIQQWLRTEPTVPLHELLQDALQQFAAGLPAPAHPERTSS
jgi:AcrR family transcriptional regulator